MFQRSKTTCRFQTRVVGIGIATVGTMFLSACVPIMGHYYEPAADGGAISRQDCHGKVGPETRISLKVGTGSIELSAYYASVDSVTLLIQYFGGKDSHIAFQAGDLKVIDGDGNQLKYVMQEYVWQDSHGRFVDGAQRLTMQPGDELSLKLDGQVPDSITLSLPSVEVDRETWQGPSVLFKKAFGFWIYPINC